MLVDIYKQIFKFITNCGYLIYHIGGQIQRYTLEQRKKLVRKRKLLSNLKQVFHRCLRRPSINYEQEQKICSLIFNERNRLNRG